MELIGFLEECERENKGLKGDIQFLDEEKVEEDTIVEYVPKIWNCGVWLGRRRTSNSCFIHHGHEGHVKGRNTTTHQITNFKRHAKKGDLIFTHSSKAGGLEHYGYFTGCVTPKEVDLTEDSRGGIYSHIYVDEWISLPEVVKGTGLNRTLYEVTPLYKNGKETKNYQNYSIPS
jgi:hypothetical protein